MRTAPGIPDHFGRKRAEGYGQDSKDSGEQLTQIAKLIDAGKLKPVIDRILPLSEARQADELSQAGHSRGKIVLLLS